MNTIPTLKSILNRDLNKLRTEIESYQNEANLWKIDGTILNTAGNLCLHLVGNLQAFIGATLGQSGYKRQREQEFGLKDVPRAKLLAEIDTTIEVINRTLDGLQELDLSQDYPFIVFKDKMSTGYFLIHLSTHLSYHLGQINYHRRLLDNA
jgi:uncharacterized damage-inducible protein DinB